MIKKYKDFLFESLLLESTLIYSDKFKNIIKEIDSPIAKALQDIESKDLTVANNYIDISDDKEQISFIPDRRAQQILSPENLEKFAIYNGDGGVLTHGPSNAAIFNLLDYQPTGDRMYRPELGTKGEVLSKAVGPSSGKTYLKIKFPDGISVINQEKIRYEDVNKLPFTQGRQKIRIGRGIKGLLASGGATFTDTELEKFVNLYKAEIEKLNDVFRHFELVKGDDIANWYDNRNYESGRDRGPLSGSCMASVPSSFFEIYTSNQDSCQLLILKTEDGQKIKGRALVWKLQSPEGITYMDRIYTHYDSDVEIFRQYAKKNGWYYKPNNNHMTSNDMVSPDGSVVRMGTLIVKVGKGGYGRYPYLDTLKYYNPENGTLSTEQMGDCYTLEDTGGSYTNNDDCDFCGGDGRVDCPDCDGDGDFRCSECDGDGDIECGECDGKGKVDCSSCDGEGEEECSSCDGTGKDGDDDCSDCDGKGKIECSSCDGEGKKECDDCSGNGEIKCDNCNSRGREECSNCDGEGRVDCPEC